MHLNIEISEDVFERLTKHARKIGSTVESVAGQKLAEIINAPHTTADVHKYWSFQGKPWTELSKEEIAERYHDAANAFPRESDEFALHEEDVKGFEEMP